MTQKNNHYFKIKCPYIHAGTIEPMCNKDILTKTGFCRTPAFKNTSKAHTDIKFGKEVKTIMVVDTSLYS